MKRLLLLPITAILALSACRTQSESAATSASNAVFKSWAATPPMGWNSWDCYGPTVVEHEVMANADYMAEHLAPYGWEYIVVDIRWFVDNDKAGGYNQKDPVFNIDEWGRYIPSPVRFPSSANGVGFKALADYVHSKGLKFGIHIMRGCPKVAAKSKSPVKGAPGVTVDMIASNDSACIWLRDNYKVLWDKKGAQEYYNSIFDLYASWGVDLVKVDDLSRPYHTAEVEMIRNAIDNTGRPIVLSLSPGETPLDKVDHVRSHANMWRTTDDFWDNWSQLSYQFDICARWAPYISAGTWPDADMLPLGKISIRGERGDERFSNFTPDEQRTLINLWSIFKSPLMFGGDLPQNDDATNALLTNRDVLQMHHYSMGNAQVMNRDNRVVWKAVDPLNGDRYAALFNIEGSGYIDENDAIYRSGTISYLTSGHATRISVDIPQGSTKLTLAVTDAGDGSSADHADWINPVVELADGSEVDLTTLTPLKAETGWGEFGINRNIEGGKLSVDGTAYDRGLAVHANSMVIFQLPEGARRFKALAGIDNTGSDQGSKSSVEFFVLNYDPAEKIKQAAAADVSLDLALLGFPKGSQVQLTDLWTGEKFGPFADTGFSAKLKPHASALYRVSPIARTDAASVILQPADDPDGDSDSPFNVVATVSGVDNLDNSYISLIADDINIVATLPVNPDGTAHFGYAVIPAGISPTSLKARFSGTATVSPAESSALSLSR